MNVTRNQMLVSDQCYSEMPLRCSIDHLVLTSAHYVEHGVAMINDEDI